jgi:hypothetical protein
VNRLLIQLQCLNHNDNSYHFPLFQFLPAKEDKDKLKLVHQRFRKLVWSAIAHFLWWQILAETKRERNKLLINFLNQQGIQLFGYILGVISLTET